MDDFFDPNYVPRDLSPAQEAVRAKYYNSQKATKKRITDKFKEGDTFTFPATMCSAVQFQHTAGKHECAGLPGIYHGCNLIGRMWMTTLEVIRPDKTTKRVLFGVKRAAIILGIDEGIC